MKTILLSMFSIALAETVLVVIGPVPGMVLHGLILVVLVNAYVFLRHFAYRRALIALTLIPLLRLLSLAVPIIQVPEIIWYVLIGVPFLATMVILNHFVHYSWDFLKLRIRSLPGQLLVGLTGIPFGLISYYILKPHPLQNHLTLFFLVGGSLVIFVFVGFLEEVLFRGILQQATIEIFGTAGILLSSLLYAIMYMGSLSYLYIIFVGFTGFLYALWVRHTGSLWGPITARTLWGIGLIIIWPILL